MKSDMLFNNHAHSLAASLSALTQSQVLPHFTPRCKAIRVTEGSCGLLSSQPGHGHEAITVPEGSCSLQSSQLGQISRVASHWRIESQKLGSEFQSSDQISKVASHNRSDTDSDSDRIAFSHSQVLSHQMDNDR